MITAATSRTPTNSTTPEMTDRAARWTPAFRVTGHSMDPTLGSGDLVVTRPRPAAVQRGVVVLIARAGEPLMVKRIAAVGGDLVELEAGRLRVNGASVDGRPRVVGARVTSWQVPAGHYFVIGDNAAASDDSRVWPQPFVRHEDVAGVPFAVFPIVRRTRART